MDGTRTGMYLQGEQHSSWYPKLGMPLSGYLSFVLHCYHSSEVEQKWSESPVSRTLSAGDAIDRARLRCFFFHTCHHFSHAFDTHKVLWAPFHPYWQPWGKHLRIQGKDASRRNACLLRHINSAATRRHDYLLTRWTLKCPSA
jgi:hypothetical protein